MDVVSACPFRVGSVLWQTARGDRTLTVVAKATYTLRPGESPLAAAQDEIHESDGYWNYDAASDLVPFKRRADVLPVNDVGINRAIMRQYGLAALPRPDEVQEIGAAWRPHASVACWYLWRSEDVKT